MRKSRLLAILIAIAITFDVTAVWTASTIEREGDPDVNAIEDSGASAGRSVKKDGNKVVRILAAPFKAFGRLFGHKDNKLQRMTEKDAENFESVGVTRVDDSRYPNVKSVSSSATAQEHLELGRSLLL